MNHPMNPDPETRPCDGCEDGIAMPGRCYCARCCAEFESDARRETSTEA